MPNPNHLQSRDGEALPSNHKSQQQRILDVLVAANGAEVPLGEVMVQAAQYSWCIHQLRKRGFKIVNRWEMRNGIKHSWYRLVSSPPDLTPRTPDPAPSRKKSVGAEVQSTLERSLQPRPSLPAQTLSLFPEMPASAPQQSAWRDPELDGLKSGSAKNGSVRHG